MGGLTTPKRKTKIYRTTGAVYEVVDGFIGEVAPLHEASLILEPLLRESNRAVDKKQRRDRLGCPYCPIHRGENAGRRVKHGAQKKRKRWSRG